jgi:hypothetical protein
MILISGSNRGPRSDWILFTSTFVLFLPLYFCSKLPAPMYDTKS